METDILPKVAKPRVTLPPNLYSAAFLLAKHFALEKKKFLQVSALHEYPKVYYSNGKFYTVPFVGKEPPAGYDWRNIGRLHSRDLFVGRSTRQKE